jgi:hypothetical protein
VYALESYKLLSNCWEDECFLVCVLNFCLTFSLHMNITGSIQFSQEHNWKHSIFSRTQLEAFNFLKHTTENITFSQEHKCNLCMLWKVTNYSAIAERMNVFWFVCWISVLWFVFWCDYNNGQVAMLRFIYSTLLWFK